MSAKILNFLPPPPCPHLDLVFTVRFTQTPLLRPLFLYPLSDADIITGGHLRRFTLRNLFCREFLVAASPFQVIKASVRAIGFKNILFWNQVHTSAEWHRNSTSASSLNDADLSRGWEDVRTAWHYLESPIRVAQIVEVATPRVLEGLTNKLAL